MWVLPARISCEKLSSPPAGDTIIEQVAPKRSHAGETICRIVTVSSCERLCLAEDSWQGCRELTIVEESRLNACLYHQILALNTRGFLYNFAYTV